MVGRYVGPGGGGSETMADQQHTERKLEQALEVNAVLKDTIKKESARADRLRDALRRRSEKIDELSDRNQALETSARIDNANLAGCREAIEKNRVTIQNLQQQVAEMLGLENYDDWVSRPPLPCPPQLQPTVQAFIAEYWRAKHKHGEMTMDGKMTGDPAQDTLLRLAALTEEVGEVAHELTYDQSDDTVEGGQLGRLMKELIQVMNVAGTWHSYLVPGPTVDRYGHTKADHDAAGACVRPPQTPAEPTADFGRLVVAEGPGWNVGGVTINLDANGYGEVEILVPPDNPGLWVRASGSAETR